MMMMMGRDNRHYAALSVRGQRTPLARALHGTAVPAQPGQPRATLSTDQKTTTTTTMLMTTMSMSMAAK
jgi:hypothetical protein